MELVDKSDKIQGQQKSWFNFALPIQFSRSSLQNKSKLFS